jgi:hypothetical protein
VVGQRALVLMSKTSIVMNTSIQVIDDDELCDNDRGRSSGCYF